MIALSRHTGSDGNRKGDFEKVGAVTIELDNKRLEGLFKNKVLLRNIFVERNIDIVHSHGLRPDMLALRLKLPTRITTIHNYPFEDYPMKYGALKGNIMARVHYGFLKNFKHRICCSESLAGQFHDRKKLKCAYIQNGIDTEIFSGSHHSKEELRKKLGLPTDKKVFIFVGSLIARKSPEETIALFEKFSGSDYFLVMLGDGPLKDSCERLHVENVKLVGAVNNVAEFLNASDYFISLSKSEGLPNTVLEALACGLPVLLSDIPSHSEILVAGSKAGALIGNGNNLNAVTDFLNRPYESQKLSARKLAFEKFSAQRMAKEYTEYYLKRL